MIAKINEEKEIRLHLMLQAEKAEKAELMKTVASLQATIEGLQKQPADAQQARLAAEIEAKKERDAMLAEIRDLGQQLRQELCWQRGQQQRPNATQAQRRELLRQKDDLGRTSPFSSQPRESRTRRYSKKFA